MIVHTSTPDLSTTTFHIPDIVITPVPPRQEASPPKPQPRSSTLPFKIFEDPPGEERGPRKIPIVDTPLSSSSIGKENRFTFLQQTESRVTESEEDMAPSGGNNDFEKEVKVKLSKITSKLTSYITLYNVDEFDARILKAKENEWMKKVEDTFHEFVETMTDVLLEDDCSQELIDEWNNGNNKISDMVKQYLLKYQMKILNISSRDSSSSGGGRSETPSEAEQSSAEARAERAAIVSAEVEAEKIRAEVKKLSQEVKKVADWEKAEHAEVESAMHKIPDVGKRLSTLWSSFFSMKKTVLTHQLDETVMRAIEGSLKILETEVNQFIEDVEFEDHQRCLYSTAKTKIVEVKFPTFAAKPDEDYRKFQKQFEEALKSNRIPKEDQCKKLRENLKDGPKNLIPESLKDIEEAFRILKDMYGDPSRTVFARKKKLQSLEIGRAHV